MVRYSTETITIPHHGFDPLLKQKALELVKGFKGLSKQIDVSQDSFYLTGDLLMSLTTELRNNVQFDGFNFTFGLDIKKRIVLILTRERGEQTGGDERYYQVPQQFFTHDQKCNTAHIAEYGIILVNDERGNCTGQLIDLDSQEYYQMIRDFRNTFAKDTPLPAFAFSLMARRATPNDAVFRPQPPKYTVVYGYFVGKEILRLLQTEGNGIKFFIGYGPSRAGMVPKNMHLLAAATANKSLEIRQLGVSTAIWGTFDATGLYAVFKMATQIDDTQDNLALDAVPTPIDGSSTCIRPKPPYESEE